MTWFYSVKKMIELSWSTCDWVELHLNELN